MKIKVGVMFGGKTVEHEISIISAIQAMGYLDRSKYDVIPIYITKNNEFYIGDKIADISAFTTTASFMIFRPIVEAEKRLEVAKYAQENLVGVPYSFFRGILTKKFPKSLKNTQCAHIVWYAYKKFGIDLDSDGRGLVTPQDLANSKQVELVQVYGFHPKKLWK